MGGAVSVGDRHAYDGPLFEAHNRLVHTLVDQRALAIPFVIELATNPARGYASRLRALRGAIDMESDEAIAHMVDNLTDKERYEFPVDHAHFWAEITQLPADPDPAQAWQPPTHAEAEGRLMDLVRLYMKFMVRVAEKQGINTFTVSPAQLERRISNHLMGQRQSFPLALLVALQVAIRNPESYNRSTIMLTIANNMKRHSREPLPWFTGPADSPSPHPRVSFMGALAAPGAIEFTRLEACDEIAVHVASVCVHVFLLLCEIELVARLAGNKAAPEADPDNLGLDEKEVRAFVEEYPAVLRQVAANWTRRQEGHSEVLVYRHTLDHARALLAECQQKPGFRFDSSLPTAKLREVLRSLAGKWGATRPPATPPHKHKHKHKHRESKPKPKSS